MAKLPPPPKEIPVNRSLDVLAPRFRARVHMVVAGMVGLGLDAYVFETLRTNERQSYLYGFGRRYDDGRGVVTHSVDADESWHHYGLAVDIISESKGWDAPPKFWRVLGETARGSGLHWGGDWKSFQDLPHVQWGSPMRQSPSPRAARLFAEGGFKAVWKEVGAA
jgi:hypothetical protein